MPENMPGQSASKPQILYSATELHADRQVRLFSVHVDEATQFAGATRDELLTTFLDSRG